MNYLETYLGELLHPKAPKVVMPDYPPASQESHINVTGAYRSFGKLYRGNNRWARVQVIKQVGQPVRVHIKTGNKGNDAGRTAWLTTRADGKRAAVAWVLHATRA